MCWFTPIRQSDRRNDHCLAALAALAHSKNLHLRYFLQTLFPSSKISKIAHILWDKDEFPWRATKNARAELFSSQPQVLACGLRLIPRNAFAIKQFLSRSVRKQFHVEWWRVKTSYNSPVAFICRKVRPKRRFAQWTLALRLFMISQDHGCFSANFQQKAAFVLDTSLKKQYHQTKISYTALSVLWSEKMTESCGADVYKVAKTFNKYYVFTWSRKQGTRQYFEMLHNVSIFVATYQKKWFCLWDP